MVKGFGFISVVLGFILLSGCQKTDLTQTAQLNFGKILVFGHAGAGMGILHTPNPPNSEESILSAIDFHGADGVEVDIQILKDSVVIVYHDNDLSTQTNCQGCLQEKTSADLADCRYRRAFMASDKGSSLVQLDKIIRHFSTYNPKPKMSLNVQLHYDCLPYELWLAYDQAFVHQLSGIISESSAHEWVWIESENTEFLQKIRSQNPDLRTFLIQPISETTVQAAVASGCIGMVCPLAETSSADIKLARDQNLLISLYNANIRKDIKAAIRLMPDCIQTDNIILTKQLLSQ